MAEPVQSDANPAEGEAAESHGEGRMIALLIGMIGAASLWGALRGSFRRVGPRPTLFPRDADLLAAPGRQTRVVCVNMEPVRVAAVQEAMDTMGAKATCEGESLLFFEDHAAESFSSLQPHLERAARYAHRKLAQRRTGETFCTLLYRSAVQVGVETDHAAECDAEPSQWTDMGEDLLRSPHLFEGRRFRERHGIAYTLDGRYVEFFVYGVEGVLQLQPPSRAALSDDDDDGVAEALRAHCVPTAVSFGDTRVVLSSPREETRWSWLPGQARSAPPAMESEAPRGHPLLVEPLTGLLRGAAALCLSRSPEASSSVAQTRWWAAAGPHDVSPASASGPFCLLVQLTPEPAAAQQVLVVAAVKEALRIMALELSQAEQTSQRWTAAVTSASATALRVADAALALRAILVARRLPCQFIHVLKVQDEVLQPRALEELTQWVGDASGEGIRGMLQRRPNEHGRDTASYYFRLPCDGL